MAIPSEGSGRDAPGEGRAPYHKVVLGQLDEAVGALSPRLGGRAPRVGVVLGSGLGALADGVEDAVRVSYTDVPHMAASTVAGHAGRFVAGSLAGVPVLCAAGRLHAYEGHPVERVVLAVRLMARLGCTAVLLTNAAGGIRQELGPGRFMLVSDHLNLTGLNPVRGFPDPFVDMTDAYSARLRRLAQRAGHDVSVDLSEGVYAGLLGPTYETPAEVRMLRTLGADAVGMSTVLETLALRKESVEVGALSCITNHAAGTAPTVLDHRDVQETARRSEAAFASLVTRWVELAGARGGTESEEP
jgi:purine-nucleoside phosphorylase